MSTNQRLEKQRKQMNLPKGWPVHQLFSYGRPAKTTNLVEGRKVIVRPFNSSCLCKIRRRPDCKRPFKACFRNPMDIGNFALFATRDHGQELSEFLASLKHKDSRISVLVTADRDAWDSLNQAIRKREHVDYVGLIREGDQITKDGLFQIAERIVHAPETDVVYTDEVHVNEARGSSGIAAPQARLVP